jgi:ascorbate-specific PTS system EIIC-type component UlaA
MNLEQAAIFFTGSILTMLGFVVIVIGAVVINNILHKYWRPVKFFYYDERPMARFIDEEDIKEKK